MVEQKDSGYRVYSGNEKGLEVLEKVVDLLICFRTGDSAYKLTLRHAGKHPYDGYICVLIICLMPSNDFSGLLML